MTVNEKVEKLRKLMKGKGLSAWIVNGTDPHESEYVCERYRSRNFISGFSGSAGTVVVTGEKALIWVDSRYFVQCAAQIKDTCFEMMKTDGPQASTPEDFLKETFKNGEKIGIAAETLMVSAKRKYQDNKINIVACKDLLDNIWTDRPAMPCGAVRKMPPKECGERAEHKIKRIREKMKEAGADWHIVSSLDDIAWILNLRGNDISDTPVFLSHLIIGMESVRLFTPEERFEKINKEGLCFTIEKYDGVAKAVSKLRGSVYLNPKRINMQIFSALKKSVKVIEGEEFSTAFKACKNEVEMEGMRLAHLMDGVAMVNFLAEVKSGKEKYTEISIAESLATERKCEVNYLGPSFDTIAGFADHGAVVHYSATEDTDKPIKGSGLLVLDSGGQYTCGTTDITRTLLFGKATKEQKEDYTLVLKGHLALASQVFPKGTNGHQLDVLAHQFLWNSGMTYFHGTGHGVGHQLSVHEGPHRISTHPNEVALEVGMVVSDEPGIYKEGKHGIRIENLIAVTEAFENEFGKFYAFETLTCCPYERDLIVKDMLTQEEIDLVDTYHAWVYKMLKDEVRPEAADYLKEATKPL